MKNLLLVFATLLIATPAAANEWGFGARVGGYGFRDHQGGWEDCRMDGVGVFAERRFGRHLFAEAGLDQYNAKADTIAREEMDRTSTHATVAAGLRAPHRWISPYIQLGAGVELTSVSMHGHHEDRTLPSGFFGIGLDVRLTSHLRVGMNLRIHSMGHFDHHSEEMTVEQTPASQGQFFLRYDM